MVEARTKRVKPPALAFSRFGSQVTQFQSAAQILTREDPDAAKIVEQALQRDGVELLTNAKVIEIKSNGNQKTIVHERDGRQQETVPPP